MKHFYCKCGHKLYFDSTVCVNCGRRTAFDAKTLTMRSFDSAHDATESLCANGVEHQVCNWLRTSNDKPFCIACALNRTIPNLSVPGNLELWRRLESGKKRLVYSLLRLGLPLTSRHDDPDGGVWFDFLEDGRTNPALFADEFHYTGFDSGTITINLIEADTAAREATREAMNEQYRTILGHMRHESGHYYFSRLKSDILGEAFTDLFGYVDKPYPDSLNTYYETGPPAAWSEAFISAYASAHPLEDWAETWAHYLHMTDALETAEEHGLVDNIESLEFDNQLNSWRELSVTLNELNRGFGVSDAYPFVISSLVGKKLAFVDRLVKSIQTLPQVPADC
ncbi:MAG: putative zinc-binding metallopeptidase [Pseudomonadota bacterium]